MRKIDLFDTFCQFAFLFIAINTSKHNISSQLLILLAHIVFTSCHIFFLTLSSFLIVSSILLREDSYIWGPLWLIALFVCACVCVCVHTCLFHEPGICLSVFFSVGMKISGVMSEAFDDMCFKCVSAHINDWVFRLKSACVFACACLCVCVCSLDAWGTVFISLPLSFSLYLWLPLCNFPSERTWIAFYQACVGFCIFFFSEGCVFVFVYAFVGQLFVDPLADCHTLNKI